MKYILCLLYVFRFLFRRPNKSKRTIIIISTNILYAQKTIPRLIRQLENSGIKSNDIFVFEGGHLQNRKKENTKINYYCLDNNSFDITGLIGIIEFNVIDFDYCFLLHDTVKVLWYFGFLLDRINLKNSDSQSITNFPSMNIGIYSKALVYKFKNQILSFKNNDFTEAGMQTAKGVAVENEDFLFKANINNRIMNSPLLLLNSSKINTNLKVKVEKYYSIGLIKTKSNYERADKWKVNIMP